MYTVSTEMMDEPIISTYSNILQTVNPIRSGGGALKAPPPPIFCSHAFNFGAALLYVGDFSQKIV